MVTRQQVQEFYEAQGYSCRVIRNTLVVYDGQGDEEAVRVSHQIGHDGRLMLVIVFGELDQVDPNLAPVLVSSLGADCQDF